MSWPDAIYSSVVMVCWSGVVWKVIEALVLLIMHFVEVDDE